MLGDDLGYSYIIVAIHPDLIWDGMLYMYMCTCICFICGLISSALWVYDYSIGQ